MDSVTFALFCGLLISGVMAIDDSLIKSVKRNAKVCGLGYFLLLLVLGGPSSCRFMLTLFGASSSCLTMLEAAARFGNLVGNGPAGVFSLSCGTVGFAITLSGTRDKRWLGFGGLLLGIFLLTLAVDALSAQR